MDAGELYESEEGFDVVFPSGDESSEVVHPGEEAFDLPALLVAAKLAPVLCFSPVAAIRGDHLDAVFVFELLVELVRVIGLVPRSTVPGALIGCVGHSRLGTGNRLSRTRHG